MPGKQEELRQIYSYRIKTITNKKREKKVHLFEELTAAYSFHYIGRKRGTRGKIISKKVNKTTTYFFKLAL